MGGCNDFEGPVFRQYPELARLQRRLRRAGADPAMMSGSGSSLFGLFQCREDVSRARRMFEKERTVAISLLSRARYHSLWWHALEAHLTQKTWPPPSRYAR